MAKKRQRPPKSADAADRYRIRLTVLRHDWRLYGVRSTPHREWFRRVLSDQLYRVAYDPEFLGESDVECAVDVCEELGIKGSPFARQLWDMRDAADGLSQYGRFMLDHIVELGDAYSAEVQDIGLDVSGQDVASSRSLRGRREAETSAGTHHFEALVERLGLSADVADIPESAIAGSSVLLDGGMLAGQSIDLVFAHVEEEMDLLISDEIDASISLDDLQPIWTRTCLALGESSRTFFALSIPWRIGSQIIDFKQVGNKCGHGWDECLNDK